MSTSVRLDRATQRQLDRLARQTGRSKSSLLREAIAVLDRHVDGSGTGVSIAEQLGDYLGTGDLGARITGRQAKALLAEGFGRRKRV